MTPDTLKLHFTLIRHLSGCLEAYREWVRGYELAARQRVESKGPTPRLTDEASAGVSVSSGFAPARVMHAPPAVRERSSASVTAVAPLGASDMRRADESAPKG